MSAPVMTSRERLLRTISRQPTDHTPLFLRFWPIQEEVNTIPFPWREQIARVENALRLGLDDTLLIQPPLGYVEDYDVNKVPGVTSQVRVEGDRLTKEYTTPHGVLRHVVTRTEDWIYGDDIYLFSDYNVPRAKEHLIKTREDIPRLRHLLADPSAEQMRAFRTEAQRLRGEAQRLGVALEGAWCALGDAAMTLCGMDRIFEAQMEEPEFVEALLDTLLEWELKRVKAVLDEGTEVVVHMAWYEGTDFWTPTNYRKLLAPRLKQIIDTVHARGGKFRYIITKGFRPLMKEFINLGIDCVTGIDPVQGAIDLVEVKQQLGGHVALMGGINSAVMLAQWSEQEIRSAVRNAMEVMGDKGFILYPVDAVFNDVPWRNVEIMIDEWRRGWPK